MVDNEGFFNLSFFSLVIKYYLGSSSRKNALKKQLKIEASSQLKKFKDVLPIGSSLAIDSHQHFHMLPFLFQILIELSSEYNINYIRIPKEKMFLCFSRRMFKNYFGMNIIKHFLLNYLSSICIPLLKGTKIKYPDYFIGVLATGNMSNSSIKSALSSIDLKEGDIVELLLHPGGSCIDESIIWKKYPQLKKYYLSFERNTEKRILLSKEFLKICDNVNNQFK